MNKLFGLAIIALLSLSSSQCTQAQNSPMDSKKSTKLLSTAEKKASLQDKKTAVFASGCFWCVEAIFESVEGVEEAISGYSGGSADDANYNDVSYGRTKHAEAVEVYYDPAVVSYETLLKVFFGSHDPTTLNRQGPDAGPQYRSAIFYNDEAEKAAAEKYIAQLLEDGTYSTITTEVAPLEEFYDAEEYHQDYEIKNPNQPYVVRVSIPRLKKFQKKYPELLKKNLH